MTSVGDTPSSGSPGGALAGLGVRRSGPSGAIADGDAPGRRSAGRAVAPGSRARRLEDDVRAFTEFVRSTEGRLYAQAYLLTADRGLAQDATQDTYERLWKHWSTVSGYDDPLAWTRQVLMRTCISQWRKRSRRRETAVTDSTAPALPPPDETHLMLVDALRRLPPAHANALVLHDGIGVPVADVARQLGVPDGTVKSWLSRARRSVSTALRVPDERGRVADEISEEGGEIDG